MLGEETLHISNYRRDWRLNFYVRETLGTSNVKNSDSSQKDERTQMLAKLLIDICIERAFPLVFSPRAVVGVESFFSLSNLSLLINKVHF